MTAEQDLLQTLFYESRPFTPAAFLQAMEEHSVLLPNSAKRIFQELAASEEVELAMLNNEARELAGYRIERPELALDVLQRHAEEVAFIDECLGNCDAAQALKHLGLDAGVRT